MSAPVRHKSRWRQIATGFDGVVTRQFPVISSRGNTHVVQIRLHISSSTVVLRFERGAFLRAFTPA